MTSANVVGYQNYDLVQGFNLYAPTFVNIDGSGSMDLQEMKLLNVVTGSGANNINILDASGVYRGCYGWWTTGDGADEDCWWDGDNWCKIEDFCGYQNRYHNSPDFFKPTIKTYVLRAMETNKMKTALD